jgi:hypothetical protein
LSNLFSRRSSLADTNPCSSTGALIALGLVNAKWTIDEALRKFKDLNKQACTSRELSGFPLLERLASMYHRSIYKSRPFERALTQEFLEKTLFGNGGPESTPSARVAVVCATLLEQTPVVFADYNRPDPEVPGECRTFIGEIELTLSDTSYVFVRAADATNEMKTWEV